MEGVLDKCLTPTTEMIANLIEIENAHINTNHPDFVGSADSLLNLFTTEQDPSDDKPGPQNFSLMPQTKKPSATHAPDGALDAEVIDDLDKEEDDQKGYLSMIGGAIWKGEKKKYGKPDRKRPQNYEEEKQIAASGDDEIASVQGSVTSSMVVNAQNRQKNEGAAQKARHDDFELVET